MTLFVRAEAVEVRDELDRLYPGRARRRVSSLAEYREHEQVGPNRWRTVAVDGEIAEWVEVTVESDPWVVKAAPGEAVRGAGAAGEGEPMSRAGSTPVRRSPGKRGGRRVA